MEVSGDGSQVTITLDDGSRIVLQSNEPGAFSLDPPVLLTPNGAFNEAVALYGFGATDFTQENDVFNFDGDSAQGDQGGALTIDLASTSLRAVAKGLSPGWLRIGGTPADGIVYEVNGGECANVSVSPEPTCQQNAVNKCDKCGDAYGCLKWQRWVELLRFANETDMRIIFGLNGCRGRSGPDTPLDFSNIHALLNKTVVVGLGNLLHGVELGVCFAVMLTSCPS